MPLNDRSVLRIGDRADEPIPAARQGHDPILPAGLLAERPTQGSYLHRQIALLDGEARPCRLKERVLGDQRSGALNKYAKQRHRTFAQRDGFSAPEEGHTLGVEAKRTECINGRDRPALPFGELSETFPNTFTTYRG